MNIPQTDGVETLGMQVHNRVLEYETEEGFKTYKVTGGLSQGSVLGPTLWNAMYVCMYVCMIFISLEFSAFYKYSFLLINKYAAIICLLCAGLAI